MATKPTERAYETAIRMTSGETVNHPDISSLERPVDIPTDKMRPMFIFLIIAILIGAFFIYFTADKFIFSLEREKSQMLDTLKTERNYNIPTLTDFAGCSNHTITESIYDAGNTYFYIATDTQSGDGGFDMMRLPDGMDKDYGQGLYEHGISDLSATDAADFLYGSWRLTVDRTNTEIFRVRYADFSSGSLDMAISNALQMQGIDEASATETGVDDAGNTFKTGVLEADDHYYGWRVSAIKLSDVYDVGLPDNAVYVGFRIERNAD